MGGLADNKQLPSGPFLHVKYQGGLIWVGSPEQCDRCKELYPMCWIEFTGTHFLCTACHWDVTMEHRDMEIAVKEELSLIESCSSCFKYFTINELGIDLNQLVCRNCAKKAHSNRVIQGERERQERRWQEYDRQEDRRRQDLKAEIELEKLLPAALREERERERVKAYYDKMSC